MTGLIFYSFMDARTFVDGNALTKRVQSLAFGAVTSFDALTAAFRVDCDIVARPRATVGAHLIRLPTSAMYAYDETQTRKISIFSSSLLPRVIIAIINQTRIDVSS